MMRSPTDDLSGGLAGTLLDASDLGLLVLAPLADFYSVNLGMFLRGFGGGVVWVFTTQLLLQNVPGAVRGRVFATEFALFALASAIGAAWTGLALDRLGISATLWLMFWLNLVPGALWFWWTLRLGREGDG